MAGGWKEARVREVGPCGGRQAGRVPGSSPGNSWCRPAGSCPCQNPAMAGEEQLAAAVPRQQAPASQGTHDGSLHDVGQAADLVKGRALGPLVHHLRVVGVVAVVVVVVVVVAAVVVVVAVVARRQGGQGDNRAGPGRSWRLPQARASTHPSRQAMVQPARW